LVPAKPRQEGGAASVPVLYGDQSLGVLSVDGLQGDVEVRKEAVEVLWRLAREAALVYHKLESGDIDVSALLDLTEE
jgi:hypothetical protein